MKTAHLIQSKFSGIRIDASLEQYRNKTIFPEKLAQANKLLANAVLPAGRKGC